MGLTGEAIASEAKIKKHLNLTPQVFINQPRHHLVNSKTR
jgi:hypothetical protein